MSETTTQPVVHPAAPAIPPEPQTFSIEYVRELREENKGWRLKAQSAETAKTAAELAAEAAKSKAMEDTVSVLSQAEQRVIRAELKAHAIKAGIVDVDGLKLIDTTGVKLNDAGDLEGAAELIEATKKAKPWLFSGHQTTSSTASAPPVAPPAEKHARDMTAAELNSLQRKLGIRF